MDRIAVDTQELSTTLRMPLGEPILVGGMTFRWPDSADGNPADRKADSEETAQMYLVLEIR